MTVRPILFSAPMVRALLDGRKTQTRRTLTPYSPDLQRGTKGIPDGVFVPKGGRHPLWPPRFAVSDLLYVREEYYQRGHWEPVPHSRTKAGRQKWAFIPADDIILFVAPPEFRLGRHHRDPITVAWHKRLARFMPRAVSRMTLAVTAVRIERLQDITSKDAQAEGVELESADPPFYYVPGIWPHSLTAVGVEEPGGHHAVRSFSKLWDFINGPGSWLLNPWVAVISFTVAQANVDA